MTLFHSTASLFSRLRTSARQDPVRDWLALLTLSILAFVCIVVWNVWAFDTVARGGIIGTTPGSSSPAFNRSSIDALHTVFEERAAEEAKYRTGVYRYADPSQ